MDVPSRHGRGHGDLDDGSGLRSSSSSNGASIGTIDNGDDLAALMDALAVPMAGLFTNLSSGAVVRDDGASVRTDGIASLTTSAACPQGGSASYTTGSPGVAAFTACSLGGVVITGSLSVVVYGQPPSYGVNLGAGTLTLGGAASGTINIVSGMIQVVESGHRRQHVLGDQRFRRQHDLLRLERRHRLPVGETSLRSQGSRTGRGTGATRSRDPLRACSPATACSAA